MTNHTVTSLLSVTDVATAAGVSEQTIRAWVKRGEFPAPIKINARTIRWSREQLQAHGIK